MLVSAGRAATKKRPGRKSGFFRFAMSSASGIRKINGQSFGVYNTRLHSGENIRVFPISNWTELDIWRYIAKEKLAVPLIYYAHEREIIRRGSNVVPVSQLLQPKRGETVEMVSVRFRTVGDMTCTCPVASTAATPEEIVAETAIARITERGATRMDDQTSEASMELRKKEGYF
jgi:sulfate adenylyltransferase subunit 2